MATKQLELNFPVRRSSRQPKPKKSFMENDFCPIKTHQKDARVPTTPQRASQLNQSEVFPDIASSLRSPSKRKPARTISPPTPPKSPRKSAIKVSVRKTVSQSQSSSQLIASSDSEDEIEWEGSANKRFSAEKCRTPVKQVPVPHNIEPGVQAHTLRTPTKYTAGGGLGDLRNSAPSSDHSSKLVPDDVDKMFHLMSQRAMRSPSKRKTDSTIPPLTPPRSPFMSQGHSHKQQSVSKECRAITVLPNTPTKTSCKAGISTPRKLLASRDVSPKKVSKGNQENFSLKSPKALPKPQTAKPDHSGYQKAKQSLHTAKPDHLIGRDQEVAEITGFLKTHLDKGSAGSLYVSGAPGTGKTAALLHIIDDFKVQYKCHIAYLNCMTVKDVSSVFKRLYSELSGKPASGRTSVKDMERLVTSSKQNMILVLDEIDQLDSKNQEVLYTIFEWPTLRQSKLILLGVANALDLTDRILPRLQAKPQCRPKLLHFAPYTRDQITAIIQDRLEQNGSSVVENTAIQFCARKVSALAGDMRKALDVCRRAVELAESETNSQLILRVSDSNSPSKCQPATVKKIGVAHISKVMSEVYGSSVQAQQSEGVPLQQKLLVCTLLLMVKTGKFKEVLFGKLHEMYYKVCRRQQMTPVDQSEFHSLCVLLEARGVVGIKKAKETRLMKITLRQDEKELEQTLQDRVLVSAILRDGLPK